MPITDVIPNPFGGFAPFPNSIMIPFMATQSAVLGYNFGIGYEIGKRTIKSLDNDFFNKIRAGSIDTISVVHDGTETKMQYNEYISFITKRHGNEQIRIFESMIPNFMKLQDTIIEKSVDIELKKANRTPSAMVEIVKAFGGSGGQEVKKQMDLFPAVERALIIQAVPILGIIYVLAGGQTFEIPPDTPKEPEPPLPDPPIVEPVSPTPVSDPQAEPFIAPEIKEPWEIGAEYRISFEYTDADGRLQNFSRLLNLTGHKAFIIFLRKRAEEMTASGNHHSAKNLTRIIFGYSNTHHQTTGIWI